MTWWISKNTQLKNLLIPFLGISIFFVSCINITYGFDFFDHLRAQNSWKIYATFFQSPTYKETSMYAAPLEKYCSPTNETNISIYMYHYVRPSHRDPQWSIIWGNSITPGTFDTHMAYVHALQKENKVHVWFMSELEQWQKEDCFPHKNIFIFTADDWWRDNYAYLFPTATKYGIKFNLGIIYDKTKATEKREGPFSSIEEVQEMANHPLIEIQSHSMTHADLRMLPYHEQVQEICSSKEWLESLLGIEINTFIAPYWWITASLPLIAKSCGYTYALSIKYWIVQPTELLSRPYNLERVRIHKNSTPQLLFWN